MATIARKSAAPAAAKGKFDGEFDVIVVGSGIAGLATALFSRWQGNKVLVLEKAVAARRHDAQGGLLVLGAEQCCDASGRHQGSEKGLHSLHGAPVAAGNVRCRRAAVRHARMGIFAVRSDLRQRLDGHGTAEQEGRAGIPALRLRARLLGRASRRQSAERPCAAAEGRAREHVRRRRSGHSAPCRPPPSATASISAPAIACSA